MRDLSPSADQTDRSLRQEQHAFVSVERVCVAGERLNRGILAPLAGRNRRGLWARKVCRYGGVPGSGVTACGSEVFAACIGEVMSFGPPLTTGLSQLSCKRAHFLLHQLQRTGAGQAVPASPNNSDGGCDVRERPDPAEIADQSADQPTARRSRALRPAPAGL